MILFDYNYAIESKLKQWFLLQNVQNLFSCSPVTKQTLFKSDVSFRFVPINSVTTICEYKMTYIDRTDRHYRSAIPLGHDEDFQHFP